MNYSPYMEAPRAIDPPYMHESEVDADEVLDVLFGDRIRDSVGRNRDDLLCDSPVGLCFLDIHEDHEATVEMWEFFKGVWDDVPASAKARIQKRLEATAQQEPIWGNRS